MTVRDPIIPVLLEKVYELIKGKIDKVQQPVVETLAKRILEQISDEDLLARNESDLYGAVLSLWHLLNQHDQAEIVVKVYNPTLAGNGWQSTHTIVEILTPDCAFLVDSVRMALKRLDVTSHLMLSGPHRVHKDNKNVITEIGGENGKLQTLFHIEVDRMSDRKEMKQLEEEIRDSLKDVKLVTDDWQVMREQMISVAKDLKKAKCLWINPERMKQLNS